MVPKPTKPEAPEEWRFTLDFVIRSKRMADYSDKNVVPTTRRTKTKVLWEIDLTAGFHQAPLDEASRVYTAFRTIHGLYEWTRVPMGTKGSGPYFQRFITTQVLDGLIYLI